jgi:hypothetical protein
MNESRNAGINEFQLYLLKTMDPPSLLLSAGLRRIDCTAADMERAYELVDPLTKLAGGKQGKNFKMILRDALVSAEPDGLKMLYRLPLLFKVSLDDSGSFLMKAEFVRNSEAGSEIPLAPWAFLESDLHLKFNQVQLLDIWGHYATYSARAISGGGRYEFRFSWGLLQEVDLVEGAMDSG